MNPGGVIYLGWRYLRQHRGRTALLILTITLSLFLPLAISRSVQAVEAHLRSRAEVTPLLLGAPGSALELVFNALYFQKPTIRTLPIGEARSISRSTKADVIPVYARYQARGFRIVGTTPDYFRFRDLRPAKGSLMGRLGDCVLGANVAESLDLGPDDMLMSTPEEMFNLAGVYPLKMRIRGVLEATGGADDDAIFCDVKTAWIIEGISHGHQEAAGQAESAILGKEGSNTTLNASVFEYQEITPENIGSFHFHGDPDTFPLTAAIVLPPDTKTETILLGRYQSSQAPAQLVRPREVMRELFDTVFQIRDFIVAALVVIGLGSALIAGLVFLLSNRLREEEFHNLANLGAPSTTVGALVAFEGGFVFSVSLLLVLLLSLALELVLALQLG